MTKEDKAWANAVKTRDGWKCVICAETNRPNAHHIIARENHSAKYDIHNGISLCPKHHFFCRQLSAHNNPMGFLIWLERNRPDQFSYIKVIMREILNAKD